MPDDTFDTDVITPANEIMLPENSGLAFNPQEWEIMKGMAAMFTKSGAFPSDDNMPKLLVKMQAGRELGMQPIQAIQNMFFVHGKLGMYSQGLLALMKKNGLKVEWKLLSAEKVTGIFSSPDQPEVEISFSKEDQTRAKLGGDNYNKYPQDMYVARCVSRAAKLFPELVGTPIETVEVLEDIKPEQQIEQKSVPMQLHTPEEKAETAKEEKAEKTRFAEELEIEKNDGKTNYETACYLIEAIDSKETFEAARKYISDNHWSAEIAYTLVEAMMEKKSEEEPKAPEVVDTVAAAEELFAGNSDADRLSNMKVSELDSIIEANGVKVNKSAGKGDKVQAILAHTEEPPPPETQGESTLDKLLGAKS